MLLKEVRVLTDLQVISESRETGVMCIRGTFQRAEEANHNQRIYPKAVLENCVKSLSEKLSGRELVGELDHPADGVVKLQNASHLITKLEWQGNDLIGEAEILPTPAGQIAKSLINAGVKIGISSRGMGTLSESARGAKIVNDDYKMITFDLVADPSTKGAYPSLAESRQHAIDFVENVIKPAISEKAFVARLKKKLDEGKKENNPWAICTAKVGRGDKAKYERCVKKVKTNEDINMNESCGPKKHSRRNSSKLKEQKTLLRRMVSEMYGVTSSDINAAKSRQYRDAMNTRYKPKPEAPKPEAQEAPKPEAQEAPKPAERQNIVSKRRQQELRGRLTRARSAPSGNFNAQMAGSMRRFGRRLRRAGSAVRDAVTLKHLQTSSRIPLTLPSLMEAKPRPDVSDTVGRAKRRTAIARLRKARYSKYGEASLSDAQKRKIGLPNEDDLKASAEERRRRVDALVNSPRRSI